MSGLPYQDVTAMRGKNSGTHTGFVDAHVHIQGSAGLRDGIAAGVVAFRDAGTKQGTGLGLDRRGGQEHAPAVLSSGWGLYKKGGYGSLFGVSVSTRGEMEKEILALKRAGAGIIKATASGMVSLNNPGRITPGGFNRDELTFIVREATRHGLGVMAHANGETAILACVEAGVRSIEHGFFMTERALGLLANKKIFWVPTVGALKRAAETGEVSRAAHEFVAGLIRSHLEMIGQAHELGVPLAVGTDCVLPDPGYQKAYEAELQYFEQAGLSRDEVLKVACVDGARLLGINT